MDFLKAEQLHSAKWKVLAIPFGGPFKGGKDLDHEYFSERTDIKPAWFASRPVLFHHGKDELIGDADIGVADNLQRKPDGWWVDMWLDRSNTYWANVNALLTAGKAYGSSGALAHLVKVAPDGEIRAWPYAEQTITPRPSNFLSRVTAAKAQRDFTSAGIELAPAIRSLLTDARDLSDLDPELPAGGDGPAIEALDTTDRLIDEALASLT